MSELSAQQRLRLYEVMLLARSLDERQQHLLQPAPWPLVATCRGHEAAQVGSAAALQAGQDILAPSTRALAAVLTLGVSPGDVLLEALGRAEGPWSGGRQLPGHYADRGRRILSRGGGSGTQISHATGAALASRLRGERAVTLCYFDAAASNQSDFHEALNFAALRQLPVVYLSEHDGWASALPFDRQSPVDSVARRAAAYGLPGEVIDGCDLAAVYRATASAVERARGDGGPSLIEARVVRLSVGSREAAPGQGPAEAGDAAQVARDPLPRWGAALRDEGLLSDERQEQILARVLSQVDAATAYACASAPPAAALATRHLLQPGDLTRSARP